MRKAVILLSIVAAVVTEAPYHLSRPGINYQQGGQQYQQQQQQQQYFQNPGYQYQQPNIGPAFVQPGFMRPQVNQQQFLQPQANQQQFFQPQANQQQFLQPQVNQQQFLQPQVNQQQFLQPQVNQQQFIQRPNVVYGSPFLRQPVAIAQPLPAPQQAGYVNGYPNQQGISFNQGFVQNYPQSIAQSPLSYNSQQSSFSSYQADNNAYTNQIHQEPLDATVVSRLENILKENEHISAKNAGYISLVSGVSLEGARPSVELSSFVQNSPLRVQQGTGPSLQELARGRSIQGPSLGLSLPLGGSGSASQSQTGANFIQQNQVSSPYPGRQN